MKKIILLIAVFSLAGITEAQSSKSLLKILVQKGILTVREADLLRVQPIDKPQKWEYCLFHYVRIEIGNSSDIEQIKIQLPDREDIKLVAIKGTTTKPRLDHFKKMLKKEDIIFDTPTILPKGLGSFNFFSIYMLNALGNNSWEVVGHIKLKNMTTGNPATTTEEIYTLKRPQSKP